MDKIYNNGSELSIVEIQRTLADGVEIATVNGTKLYAPGSISGKVKPADTSFFSFVLTDANVCDPGTCIDPSEMEKKADGSYNGAHPTGWTNITFPVVAGHLFSAYQHGKDNYGSFSPVSGNWHFYDSSGNFLSTTTIWAQPNTRTITVPADAATCLFSTSIYDRTHLENIMVWDYTEYGDLHTDYGYVPFGGRPYIDADYLLAGYKDTVDMVNMILNGGWAENRLKGKKVLVFGDSIAYGAGSGGFGFASALAEIEPQATFISYAVGGAYFSDKQEASPNRILTQIETAYTQHPDADLIILSGGFNDGTYDLTLSNDWSTFDTSKWTGGMEEAIRYIQTHWQGKKMVFVTTHWVNTWVKTTADQFADSIKAVCAKWGVPVLDNVHELGASTKMFDGTATSYSVALHPPKWFYQEYFGPNIAGFLRSRL